MIPAPGPERDALIADRVFGMVPCDKWAPINMGSMGGPAMMKGQCQCDHDRCYPAPSEWAYSGPRLYSTDDATALEVVKHTVKELGWSWMFDWSPNGVAARICGAPWVGSQARYRKGTREVSSPGSLADAITAAALEAL